jgi:hypothetical protein
MLPAHNRFALSTDDRFRPRASKDEAITAVVIDLPRLESGA